MNYGKVAGLPWEDSEFESAQENWRQSTMIVMNNGLGMNNSIRFYLNIF